MLDGIERRLQNRVSRNGWSQFYGFLLLILCVRIAVAALDDVHLLYIIYRKGESASVPINGRLRDGLGNYCLYPSRTWVTLLFKTEIVTELLIVGLLDPAFGAVKYEVVTLEDEKIYMTRSGLPTLETD